MGTCGARKGYKIFCFNTTIRNPKRNTQFLEAFKSFDGKLMNDLNLYNYLFALVRVGVYQFQHLDNAVRAKIEAGIPLDANEVETAIKENPQATGLSGRVMTHLRALKDQGFLMFTEDSQTKKPIVTITGLGNALIKNAVDASIIYTKAMVGSHSFNPARTSQLNKSIPFLNTIFTIDGVNKEWAKKGKPAKGILRHEFSYFVLSLKDCNYEKAISDILKYREKFGTTINEKYLQDYLAKNEILPIDHKTAMTYGDEVFRKFSMTGLIVEHGKFGHIYVNFSDYNKEKIEALLKSYAGFSFQEFKNQEAYYKYLESIVLPWEANDTLRRQIVETKAKVLDYPLNPNINLEQQEEMLDRVFYSHALAKVITKTDLAFIYKELLILANKCREKSKLHDIAEPLRLEYLLALLLGKQYGSKGLVSNIIYDEDGLPLHHAPSNKPDIIYHSLEGNYIFEPTMQSSRDQQLNTETANIVRHVQNEEARTGFKYRVAMIAPKVHSDVMRFFAYEANQENVKIAALSIAYATVLFEKSKTISELNNNFDPIVFDLINSNTQTFADKINSISLPPSLTALCQ